MLLEKNQTVVMAIKFKEQCWISTPGTGNGNPHKSNVLSEFIIVQK